jgi:CRISPR-associated helicase Cas3/CRISPR-associated endonuclease Cas3-HD
MIHEQGPDRQYLHLAQCVWAKTDMANPESLQWSCLTQHLMDTYLTAGNVYDHFLSESVKRSLNQALNQHARIVLSFLAGVHDVGKCSPAFEKQARYRQDLMDRLSSSGMIIPEIGKSSVLRHEISGFYALRSWFSKMGINQKVSNALSIVVGGHHGIFHAIEDYGVHSERRKLDYYGDKTWAKVRLDVIDDMARRTGFSDIVSTLNGALITQPIQSILSGCVVVSDWIASSTYLFSLTSQGLSDQRYEQQRSSRAWSELHLPTPWTYHEATSDDHILHDRFQLPDTATMNGMQMQLHEQAQSATSPSMFIVEAPMGGGKTEAALIAAEDIARNTGAGGLIFALPTQATANGILPRVTSWITRSTDDRESFELLHGSAFLNEDYDALRHVQTCDDYEGIEVNRWFDGSKRGLLANFVVSTIDQVLMSALQSKHFDLRHLGLSNKVIILDEVHAADDYMAVYLDRAIEWLAALGSSIILLSATLPEQRRDSMIKSYQRGLNVEKNKIHPDTNAYPLITTVNSQGLSYAEPKTTTNEKTIYLHHICESSYTDVVDLLNDKLSDGGNAVIIRNTVKSAQETLQAFLDSDNYDDRDLILLHSRFIAYDRQDIEEIIRSCYGPHSDHRPRRTIVIGTQILEQSLDIDFDIMVSDLAPIDLILQRSGRLHRRDGRIRPKKLALPELWIDQWSDDGSEYHFDTGALYVYGSGHAYSKVQSKLMRSIDLLRSSSSIIIPTDIPRLIQDGYDYHHVLKEAKYPDTMQEEDLKQIENMHESESRATAYLLRPPYRIGGLINGETVPSRYESGVLWGSNDQSSKNSSDEHLRAQVRDSEAGGITVLMMIRCADGGLRFIPSELDDQYGVLNEDTPPDRSLSITIAKQSIGLPSALSGPWIVDRTISWLEKNGCIASWQQSPLLKGEFALLLDEQCHKVIHIDDRTVFTIDYNELTGLSIRKQDEGADT